MPSGAASAEYRRRESAGVDNRRFSSISSTMQGRTLDGLRLHVLHVDAELRDIRRVVLERLQLHLHVSQSRQRLPLKVQDDNY